MEVWVSGVLVVSGSGRLAEYDSTIQLWTDGEAPAWAKRILHEYRNDDYNLSTATNVAIRCYTTRADFSTMFVCEAKFLNIYDEQDDGDESEDLLEVCFEDRWLPGTGGDAGNLFNGAKMTFYLRLSEQGDRSGYAEVRYLSSDGADMEDDHVCAYLEMRAPFPKLCFGV